MATKTYGYFKKARKSEINKRDSGKQSKKEDVLSQRFEVNRTSYKKKIHAWVKRFAIKNSPLAEVIFSGKSIKYKKSTENEIIKKISLFNDIIVLGYQTAYKNNITHRAFLEKYKGFSNEMIESQIEELKEKLYTL